jgi:hypothetical protein
LLLCSQSSEARLDCPPTALLLVSFWSPSGLIPVSRILAHQSIKNPNPSTQSSNLIPTQNNVPTLHLNFRQSLSWQMYFLIFAASYAVNMPGNRRIVKVILRIAADINALVVAE